MGTERRILNVATAKGSRGRHPLRGGGEADSSRPEAIAPGIAPTPAHDLVFHGGRTIPDLAFTNLYVGGDAWQDSDIQAIDGALSAAMSDAHLNNVMVQYFPGRTSITLTFKPSTKLPGTAPSVVSQGDAEAMIRSLHDAGSLDGFDLPSTVFCLMLPSGTVLNTDSAPTGGASRGHARVAGGAPTAEAHSPAGVTVVKDTDDSTNGLGGYHGSIHAGSQTIYYAVGVYSEVRPDGTTNGIPVFPQPWKNVVATFYHELNEARTDADVEDAINAGSSPSADKFVGWVSAQGEECGDFPVSEANPLTQVFKEVPLADGSGTVPVQFQYSNAVHGPEGPISAPHSAPQAPPSHPGHHKKHG